MDFKKRIPPGALKNIFLLDLNSFYAVYRYSLLIVNFLVLPR